jgi:hypothetical protein
MIQKKDLPKEFVPIGEFIGLLKPGNTPDTVDIDTTWFSDPITPIKNSTHHFQALAELIDGVLGPGVASPLGDGGKWYVIPNPASGAATPFCLATPGTAATSGQLGLGVLHNFSGGVKAQAYFDLPLFNYTPSGVNFVATTSPMQVGCTFTSKDKFVVGNVSFTGLQINAQFYLAAQMPSISVTFQGLQGAAKSTYTSLLELLDPTVLSWLLEVLVQASTWINQFAGNVTYTIGDLLEAAGILNRNYLLEPTNFADAQELAGRFANAASDPVAPEFSAYIWSQFSVDQQKTLANPQSTNEQLIPILLDKLNTLIKGPNLFTEERFGEKGNRPEVPLSMQAVNLLTKNAQGADLIHLNRLLVQDAYRPLITENPYSISIDQFKGKDAITIAQNIVFAVLNALSEFNTPLIMLPGGAISIARQNNADNSSDYGLDIVAKLELGGDTPDPVKPRKIEFCLGQWLTGETDTSNWMSRSQKAGTPLSRGGLQLYFLRRAASGALSFQPGFALTSAGFNIIGAENTPLVNVGGYTIKEIELRASIHSSNWAFGGACRIDDFGMPLSPGFNSGPSANGNPVAQNLLASAPADKKPGDKDPVNPTYSFAVAYMQGGQFDFKLYDKNGKPTNVVMIPVNRTLGPLHCERLGLGWMPDTKTLSLLFDGDVTLASLQIALQGLSVGIPVTSPADLSKYSLDLQGMGITFSQNGIELSAAFVKIPPDPKAKPPRNYAEYAGSALIKAGTFTITALGSYAYVPVNNGPDGYTSMFIFGLFLQNLGGPAFFYVTGLAAGFGYNRKVILPGMNDVPQFPFVAALNDPSSIGAKKQPDGTWKSPDPVTALTRINNVVPPERGTYWFTAGVRFTSFDLINSSALLMVEFGNEFEISLMGISWMSLPPPAAPGTVPPNKFAYAELGIQVKFLPNEGFLGATAVLTGNSFVLDPACKLTGGFAFYVWFGDNPNAGKFVLTLGGYHPDFIPPSYYPTVPRLGFNWPVSNVVTIKGDAYFALTPSAIMAGAGLQVLFSSGNLNAWFIARMDALIVWAPFHYKLNIQISVGVSYRLHLLFVTVTLKIELGAQLTIWGPKMGGVVHIDWYIISFSIPFGANEVDQLPPLEWKNQDGTGFAQTLLPHKTTNAASRAKAAARTMANTNAAGSIDPHGVYAITVNKGLLSNWTNKANESIWIVRPNDFTFSVMSAIPATQINIATVANEPPGTQSSFNAPYTVCVRPMKATLSSSVVTVTLTRKGDPPPGTFDLAGAFDHDIAIASVPAAKWGPVLKGTDPEPNELLTGRYMGLEKITPKAPVLTPSGDNALNIDVTAAYAFDVVDNEDPYNPNHLPLQPGISPTAPVPGTDGDAVNKIKDKLMNPDVVTARNEIFAALSEFGVNAGTNGSLDVFAANPKAVLTGNPFILVTKYKDNN